MPGISRVKKRLGETVKEYAFLLHAIDGAIP